MTDRKPILCLDFDGVIHSYTSGWKGADVIPDPPVDGSMEFICSAMNHFDLAIYSSRSGQEGGIEAMQSWLFMHLHPVIGDVQGAQHTVLYDIKWPTEKPPAMVTIDDRAITFEGEWPSIDLLLNFKPWNK